LGIKHNKDKKSFIYKIENILNGKIYIGQSIWDHYKKKSHHFCCLKNQTHRNSRLQEDYDKYGKDVFRFQIIKWVNKEELNQNEIYFIEKYDSNNPEFGYNIREGGINGKQSKETKDKISKNSPHYWKGKTFPEETRYKMSLAKKGKCSGVNNPFYGKKHSQATVKKIIESGKGRIYSKNTIIKRSNSRRGRGKFGFTGANYKHKKRNPSTRVWQAQITFNGYNNSLGYYNDPLSCEIIYKLVWEEIYGEKYLSKNL
jgi:group I intron endonuclease